MILESLDPSRIKLGMDPVSRDDILRELGATMVAAGLCRDTYPEALCAREKDSPTGLDMGGFGIAIPHTDVTHVISPGIAIGVPGKPVRFTAMGTDDEFVDARIVMALAIDDPGAHLDFVEALLAILRDRATLESLAAADSAGEVMEIIRAKERAAAKGGSGKEG
ncbi:MAG: PTS sugar transporter subunit IIA [Deltaproteobacteria bacterium]|jgi:PTS system galactitol-specific IIA component|nr:PTS sugar transporter subunit IIA [Deltaproteobacteria bacterium]